uniref:Cilia and flagella associated protein 161 n=1 Tax=Sinocyclocheilus rhinocerous TaxID=307959 RepID=A0A673G2A1_9TELE
MAHVRIYNPRVRVANWKEDVTLEEETRKNFILQKDRGELTVQKDGALRQNILKPVSLSVSQDGFLHFGDTVVLVNSGGGEHAQRGSCVLSAPPSRRSPQHDDPLFARTYVDGTSDGEVLRYDQSFALRTTAGFAGKLFLASDNKTFLKCAKKSRLQELSLVEEFDFLCWWKVIYVDPQERLENEGYPVQVNSKVLISHCKTNQCLAALGNHILWTLFGKAYELTAHTILDSHKAERDNNHWLFFMAYPANQNQSLMQLQQDSDTTDEQREKQEDTQIKECS